MERENSYFGVLENLLKKLNDTWNPKPTPEPGPGYEAYSSPKDNRSPLYPPNKKLVEEVLPIHHLNETDSTVITKEFKDIEKVKEPAPELATETLKKKDQIIADMEEAEEQTSELNERAKYIYQKLTGAGMNHETAVALIGNLKQESLLNPTAVNKSSKAYGLGQWLGARLKSLKAYADEVGTAPSDIDTQLDFILIELGKKAGNSAAYKQVRWDAWQPKIAKALGSGYGLEQLTTMFRRLYFRPGEYEAKDFNRIDFAKEIDKWLGK